MPCVPTNQRVALACHLPVLSGRVRSAERNLKIEKDSEEGKTTVHLVGRLQLEHLDELTRQLQGDDAQLILDLQEVTLVDVDVVRFLADCEARGMKLIHCAPYIREWMAREKR
jgi:hypothetical protein